MEAWLYPVSGAGKHRFREASGRRRRTTFDEIRSAIESGEFSHDHTWPCVQSGGLVSAGDTLFLYTGESDVGIFAAGTIANASPNQRGKGWLLTWKMDAARTNRLLAKPVPAPKVRSYVHPRVTVRNFTAGARALRRLLA